MSIYRFQEREKLLRIMKFIKIMQQKGKKEALLAEDQNSKVQLLPKQGLEGEKIVL